MLRDKYIQKWSWKKGIQVGLFCELKAFGRFLVENKLGNQMMKAIAI